MAVVNFDPCTLIESLVGDVNLFFNDHDNSKSCEINVMIGNDMHRRKGMAREALLLIMQYGIQHLSVERYYCKIHETNEGSVSLFRSLGFEQVNYVSAFKEYEYEFKVAMTESVREINPMFSGYSELPFDGDR